TAMERSRFHISIGWSHCTWSVKILPMLFAPAHNPGLTEKLAWKSCAYWRQRKKSWRTRRGRTPLTKQQFLGMLHDLATLESIDFVQIIDMCQDEVQITGLTALAKIVCTCAISNNVDGCTTPLLDNCRCAGI